MSFFHVICPISKIFLSILELWYAQAVPAKKKQQKNIKDDKKKARFVIPAMDGPIQAVQQDHLVVSKYMGCTLYYGKIIAKGESKSCHSCMQLT